MSPVHVVFPIRYYGVINPENLLQLASGSDIKCLPLSRIKVKFTKEYLFFSILAKPFNSCTHRVSQRANNCMLLYTKYHHIQHLTINISQSCSSGNGLEEFDLIA